MSVQFKDASLMLYQMVKDFAEKEVKPFDMLIDENKKVPPELWQKVINLGFLGLNLPTTYGGSAFDPVIEATVIYELARKNASLAFTLEAHYKSVDQVLKYASESLKHTYLPQANHRIFGFGSTEPTGGSNILGINGVAKKVGDKWVLSGNKIMITNGNLAEVFTVLLKTGPEEVSAFLVDNQMSGFKYGKLESFIGMRGTPVGEIFLENVTVSEDHLLGKLGQGIEIGDNAHYDARINMGAIAAGIIEHALTIAVNYAKQRKALTSPIIDLFAIQNKITEIAIAHQNTKLLFEEAAQLKLLKLPYAKVATMAKSYGARAAFEACNQAMQVMGAYGYSQEYPIEHLLRDSRALSFAEGSLEKMVIEISKFVKGESE